MILNHQKWKIKYPDIYDGEQISIHKLAQLLEIYNTNKNDINTLEILGLVDFYTDVKNICDPNWLKHERLKKLIKISKNK